MALENGGIGGYMVCMDAFCEVVTHVQEEGEEVVVETVDGQVFPLRG